ncbi:hypothetical protein HGRIS_001206 [Hohenbuehelia grisea]|uniref:Uncharacterized protein n=1 Tax=Hohenbuehelia grisea TaxID=104357 RepID=A0ABR3JPM2_9AGAR
MDSDDVGADPLIELTEEQTRVLDAIERRHSVALDATQHQGVRDMRCSVPQFVTANVDSSSRLSGSSKPPGESVARSASHDLNTSLVDSGSSPLHSVLITAGVVHDSTSALSFSLARPQSSSTFLSTSGTPHSVSSRSTPSRSTASEQDDAGTTTSHSHSKRGREGASCDADSEPSAKRPRGRPPGTGHKQRMRAQGVEEPSKRAVGRLVRIGTLHLQAAALSTLSGDFMFQESPLRQHDGRVKILDRRRCRVQKTGKPIVASPRRVIGSTTSILP